MIDLHCHMLPGIDDGAPDMDTALDMARAAVADGITVTACTPHIYPGLFPNTPETITGALEPFKAALAANAIALEVVMGADIQIRPDLSARLADGTLPTLGGGRYFLFEPPHHLPEPAMLDLCHSALASGYVPLVTHPERLAYVDAHYDDFVAAHEMGAWIQITGGALLGLFGPRPKAVSERLLREGRVHVIASDGHNLQRRTPTLALAREAAAAIVGEEEATQMVFTRPRAVLDNLAPAEVAAPVMPARAPSRGFFGRLFGR